MAPLRAWLAAALLAVLAPRAAAGAAVYSASAARGSLAGGTVVLIYGAGFFSQDGASDVQMCVPRAAPRARGACERGERGGGGPGGLRASLGSGAPSSDK